jgi:3-isopropylmalate/(R)-2-methylmalate dehydratase small subunit
MPAYTSFRGVAAPMPIANIDTDMLCPSQFLYTVEKSGLGGHLFYEFRHTASGEIDPAFIINQAPYDRAEILIAGENFGSGSSREHAAWALKDFGIRCVIARSFADIFYMNALKNGILLIALDEKKVDTLVRDTSDPANAVLGIDLVSQRITRPNGEVIEFSIDPFRRDYLLQGLTDVGELDKMRSTIEAFEARHRSSQPWLFEPEAA